MKIKVNRNIFWTNLFTEQLAALGLKYVCISPGSRSTPLTIAFAQNKSIRNYVHIDERSSAFFALGLAKATGKPATVVCTSGTAAVELYPAIVEAYQQRVPLIICTADRPPDQRGRGANQTINQENLYKNHIRFFTDAGLPCASAEGAGKIQGIAVKAYATAVQESGPVHINFPFKKPFEPDSFTDEVEDTTLNESLNESSIPGESGIPNWFFTAAGMISRKKNIMIIAGPAAYDPEFNINCKELSERLNAPVLADVCSHLRFGKKHKNIITTYDALLRNESFRKNLTPDLIIQFGRTPTSKMLLKFFEESTAQKILINDHGDWFDPSGTASASYAMSASKFCRLLLSNVKESYNNKLTDSLNECEKSASGIRSELLSTSLIDNEAKVIFDVLESVPSATNIMISNSSPIRDLDYFIPGIKKNIILHFNRGASGIDGIISTALGITAAKAKPALLITGDLSFLYDITALVAGKQNKLPLTIVLLNNNGGGIFNNLPISEHKKIFNRYFSTPHNLDFGPLVKSFGWDYSLAVKSSELKKKIADSLLSKGQKVIEVRTDPLGSLEFKKRYWKQIAHLKFLHDDT